MNAKFFISGVLVVLAVALPLAGCSSGESGPEVPDVIGWPQGQAKTMIEDAGLTADFKNIAPVAAQYDVYTPETENCSAIVATKQTPEAGESASGGSVVSVLLDCE